MLHPPRQERVGVAYVYFEEEQGECYVTKRLTKDEAAHGGEFRQAAVAALGSGVDRLGPFVDGDAILDGILRRSRSARAAAFVPAREITP